jgi:hypothetical protein
MLPLSWFLLAWLVLVIIHLLIAGITLMMHLRYGVTGFGTYTSSLVFVGVIAFTLLLTGSYLIMVDWTQTIPVLPGFSLTIPSEF